jgi:hypothetical protein
MIDCILKFTDRAAAISALQAHAPVDGGGVRQWAQDHVLPVQVWRDSQDVGGVHTYLTGYFVLVALDNPPANLLNLAAIQFAVDRDLANARQAGMVLKSNVSQALLQDLRISPLFAGADWPFGVWS